MSSESGSSKTSEPAAAPPGSSLPRWIVCVAMFLAFVGSTFRVVGLERKSVWFDEAYTMLMVHGWTSAQFLHGAFDGPVTAGSVAGDLQNRPTLGILAVVRNMATHDTEHTPLYYAVLNAWARLMGASAQNLRLLSALAGVAALPAAFWAGRQAGGDDAAILLVALVAVSPLHLAYAQEAREYAFWIVALFVQFGAFVRALRLGGMKEWAIYVGATTVAFYCHPFSGLVLAAQAAAVVLFRIPTGGRFWKAAAASGATFLPWAALMVERRHAIVRVTNWMHRTVSLPAYLRLIAESWSQPFLSLPNRFLSLGVMSALALIVAFTAIIAALRAIRRADRPLAAALTAGLLSVTMPLLLADLKDGGGRAHVVRYNFPDFIALEVGVAAFLAAARPRTRAVGFAIAVAAGVVSSALYLRADDWWTKPGVNRSLVRIVNGLPDSLIVVDQKDQESALRLAGFAVDLRPDVMLLRAPPGPFAEVPDWRQREVFLPWFTPGMEAWAQSLGANRIAGSRGGIYHIAPSRQGTDGPR